MIPASLQNRRVLVVEDEYFLAQALSCSLQRAGATVLGPVPDVASALELLNREADVDGAVLDINLGEQKVYPVVDALLARGTKCVFATGNNRAEVPALYASLARCEKPLGDECIVAALLQSGDTIAADKALHGALTTMRGQLVRQIEVADKTQESLLAVRLCEALEVLDDILAK